VRIFLLICTKDDSETTQPLKKQIQITKKKKMQTNTFFSLPYPTVILNLLNNNKIPLKKTHRVVFFVVSEFIQKSITMILILYISNYNLSHHLLNNKMYKKFSTKFSQLTTLATTINLGDT
jgi:hypothetical protein